MTTITRHSDRVRQLITAGTDALGDTTAERDIQLAILGRMDANYACSCRRNAERIL